MSEIIKNIKDYDKTTLQFNDGYQTEDKNGKDK